MRKAAISCIKDHVHDYNEIYSFAAGSIDSEIDYWKLYECKNCKDVQLISNKDK